MKPKYYIIDPSDGSKGRPVESLHDAERMCREAAEMKPGCTLQICEVIAIISSPRPEVRVYWLPEREHAEIVTRDEQIRKLKNDVAHLEALCKGK